jgi:hypothetical protein
VKRIPLLALLFLVSTACVDLTPEESCAAICSELQSCGIAINGSTLAEGASCESDCLSRIEARGGGCKGSAANLGDCFQTYTCDGNSFCSDEAGAFREDCG